MKLRTLKQVISIIIWISIGFILGNQVWLYKTRELNNKLELIQNQAVLIEKKVSEIKPCEKK